MDKIVVTISGFLGIVLIYWFFFMKKEDKREAVSVKGENQIDVVVNGGYQPSTLVVVKGKKTILNFKRIDANSCLEEVVIPDFKIKRFLPLNEKVAIELTPKRVGEFGYSCGMGMYHGKIIVKGKEGRD